MILLGKEMFCKRRAASQYTFASVRFAHSGKSAGSEVIPRKKAARRTSVGSGQRTGPRAVKPRAAEIAIIARITLGGAFIALASGVPLIRELSRCARLGSSGGSRLVHDVRAVFSFFVIVGCARENRGVSKLACLLTTSNLGTNVRGVAEVFILVLG